ncbi:aldehyde dehydrogenase family protein [Fusibacter sp. JL298sf-3]
MYDKLYIDGQWCTAVNPDTIAVENPADKSVIASVPRGGAADVDAAVAAAKRAFDQWSTTPLAERKAVLEAALSAFKTYESALVTLEAQELGAPLNWSRQAHVVGPIKRFEHFLKIIDDVAFESQFPKFRVVREPIGVVACITPWNYPLGQVMQKVIPALLCGNTVVLKPSQITPLSAFYLAKAFEAAHLPAGVFNLVTGRGGEVGNALAGHSDVDMVSFTGSTDGGREVGKCAIDGIRKLSLELGGKSAAVLLESGDIDLAVDSVLGSCFLNTGQTCAALTRFLVPASLMEAVKAKIVEKAAGYCVGNPFDEGVHIGPLASEKQFNKVKRYIEIGIEEGAELLVGAVPTTPDGGYYVEPVVFAGVHNAMQIAREEIFGPVICLMAYEGVDEAVAIANDSPYGLSGAVYGTVEEAGAVARRLKTGSVTLNRAKWDASAPFGGYKQSGIGREGGPFGIEEFLEIKTIFDVGA